jgi:hypothetical protein
MNIGNYEPEHFGLCPIAEEAFDESIAQNPTCPHFADRLEEAARAIDQALGIIKLSEGTLNSSDFERVMDFIDDAETALDEVGELDSHFYLRDQIEPLAAELYDMEDLDTNDLAEDEADEEKELFGESAFEQF